jgi:hypothetical protein
MVVYSLPALQRLSMGGYNDTEETVESEMLSQRSVQRMKGASNSWPRPRQRSTEFSSFGPAIQCINMYCE